MATPIGYHPGNAKARHMAHRSNLHLVMGEPLAHAVIAACQGLAPARKRHGCQSRIACGAVLVLDRRGRTAHPGRMPDLSFHAAGEKIDCPRQQLHAEKDATP